MLWQMKWEFQVPRSHMEKMAFSVIPMRAVEQERTKMKVPRAT